jgi:hypothetical protein
MKHRMDHTVSWELQSISRLSNTFQHNYRYPADRVFPYTSFKSKQGSGCASMRSHVPYSFGPHLPAEVVSGAVTCPAAPNLSSLPMWALTPPRVPRPRTSPLCRGGLQRFHMSLSFGSRFPAEVGSDASTCPMAPVLSRVPQPPVGCGP